jgi:integrase
MGHKGGRRIILLGPKAQALITPYLLRPADAYLFSPREAVEKQLGELNRRVRHGPHPPRDHYCTITYRHAIQNACRRAGVPTWHPHQLRHNAATRLTEQFGWEIARVLLGHQSVETTRIYAADTYRNAADAAREVG